MYWIYTGISIGVLVFSSLADSYITGVIIASILGIVVFLNKIGKGFFMREIVFMHTVFTYLTMPLVGYLVYNREHKLAFLWRKYMPVDENQYFGFALPAVLLFGMALLLPPKDKEFDGTAAIQDLIKRIREQLDVVPPTLVLGLMAASFVAYFVQNLLPEAVQQIMYFLYLAFFTALLYIVYSRRVKRKFFFLTVGALFVVWDTLKGGMFTIIVYMGATLLMFYLGTRKVPVYRKILILVTGVLAIFFIQFFKLGYRSAAWSSKADVTTSDALDVALAGSVQAFGSNEVDKAAFPLYYRMNQGFNVALTMKYIPAYKPYAEGSELLTVIASSFVPRLFWQDKPMAGGKYNMERYTGYLIKGWSTNVGPVGEAYGNFGRLGGVIYITVFGLFLRWSFLAFMNISKRVPLVLLWAPVLFFQITYVMETDSLQAFNSVLKGSMFIFLAYKLLPRLFGKPIK